MKPLDYTLYNRVKEKFPPQPFTVIFVSLSPENLEQLEGISFKIEELSELRALAGQHAEKVIAYATIGGFNEKEVGFHFSCKEFVQEEDLILNRIVGSSIGTYHKKPVDLDALNREIRQLTDGTLLSGNA